MRISDWSSDVCSADLGQVGHRLHIVLGQFAEYDAAVEIEHVCGTEDDPGGAHEGDPARGFIDAREAEEFADATAGPGQARSEERRVGKGWVSTWRSRG